MYLFLSFFLFFFFRVTHGGSQATAMPDLSHICDPYHNSWQCQILNPLNDARDQTCVLMDPSQIHFCCATMGTPPNVSYYEWGWAYFPVSTNVSKFTALAHFSAGLLEFFLSSSERSFLIKKISPLPVTWATNIFSHELYFTLFMAFFFFCYAEVFDFFKVSSILIFVLITSWFGSIIRKAFSYSSTYAKILMWLLFVVLSSVCPPPPIFFFHKIFDWDEIYSGVYVRYVSNLIIF